jgi:histidinol-phosphate aminotransferase
VAALHAGLPAEVILVLDEAYAEFAHEAEGYGSGLDLAREAPNLFVTRTFSKAYGLAALRVGWGYAPAAMEAAMDRIRPPFNVSRAAEVAALAALGDEDFLHRSQGHVARWRPKYAEGLERARFPVTPSATNFLTFGVPASSGWTAAALEAALSEQGLIVRGLKGYGLADHLRVTIGDDPASTRFLLAITELAACPQT